MKAVVPTVTHNDRLDLRAKELFQLRVALIDRLRIRLVLPACHGAASRVYGGRGHVTYYRQDLRTIRPDERSQRCSDVQLIAVNGELSTGGLDHLAETAGIVRFDG